MYKCNEYRKMKNPKMSYIFNKTLVFLLVVSTKNYVNKKMLSDTLEILDLINSKKFFIWLIVWINIRPNSNFSERKQWEKNFKFKKQMKKGITQLKK